MQGCVWYAGWIRSWGVVVNGRVVDQRRGHLIPRCPKLGRLASNTQCPRWVQTQCPRALPFQPHGVRRAGAGGGRRGRRGRGGRGEVRAISN